MLWPVTVSSSCRWIWRRSSNLRPLGSTPEPNLTLIEIHICSHSWTPVDIIWKTFIGHVVDIIMDFSYQDECFFFQWIVHSSCGPQKTQMTVFYSVVLKRAQRRPTCSLFYLGKRPKQNMLILGSKYKKPPFVSTKRSCQAIPGLILMLWLSLSALLPTQGVGLRWSFQATLTSYWGQSNPSSRHL